MATKKVTGSLNLDNIRCKVDCPECGKSVTMKMVKPITRKNCPKCNRLTYIFTVIPIRGYISITVITVGMNFAPTPYELSADDIEIEYDEENSDD